MMKLPALGTAEKTDSSQYQIMLTDKTNKSIHPMDYPRINRFFDNLNDRNTFIQLFQNEINKAGGRLIHNERMSHPVFASIDIYDYKGNVNYELVVYH